MSIFQQISAIEEKIKIIEDFLSCSKSRDDTEKGEKAMLKLQNELKELQNEEE